MSKNYQSGDIWSRATTLNGFAVDELRSVLQKSIRRGMVEEAALAAYELFANGLETEQLLWRRLETVSYTHLRLFIEQSRCRERRATVPRGRGRYIASAHKTHPAQRGEATSDRPGHDLVSRCELPDAQAGCLLYTSRCV